MAFGVVENDPALVKEQDPPVVTQPAVFAFRGAAGLRENALGVGENALAVVGMNVVLPKREQRIVVDRRRSEQRLEPLVPPDPTGQRLAVENGVVGGNRDQTESLLAVDDRLLGALALGDVLNGRDH